MSVQHSVLCSRALEPGHCPTSMHPGAGRLLSAPRESLEHKAGLVRKLLGTRIPSRGSAPWSVFDQTTQPQLTCHQVRRTGREMFEQLCCHPCKGLRCHCTMTELPAAPAWSRQNKPQKNPKNTEFPQQGYKEIKQLQNNSVVSLPGQSCQTSNSREGWTSQSSLQVCTAPWEKATPWPPENPARLHRLLPARSTTLTSALLGAFHST